MQLVFFSWFTHLEHCFQMLLSTMIRHESRLRQVAELL